MKCTKHKMKEKIFLNIGAELICWHYQNTDGCDSCYCVSAASAAFFLSCSVWEISLMDCFALAVIFVPLSQTDRGFLEFLYLPGIT